MREVTTLGNLMKELNGKGYVIMDRGQGSRNPRWVDWNEEQEKSFGSVKMCPLAGEPEEDIVQACREVFLSNIVGPPPSYKSAWISKDPGSSSNPYAFRIIF